MNRYFYIDNEGKQRGSYSPDELKLEGISKNTLVWTQGMSEWKPVSEVAELSFLFADSAGYYPSEQTQSMPAPPSPQAQQRTQQSGSGEPMPKNWLVESILVTVLPFLLCSNMLSLLGIIAIVNASKVESLFLRGDHKGADEAAAQAKRWTKITFWIAIGWILLLVLFFVGILVFGFSMAGLGDLINSSTYSI